MQTHISTSKVRFFYSSSNTFLASMMTGCFGCCCSFHFGDLSSSPGQKMRGHDRDHINTSSESLCLSFLQFWSAALSFWLMLEDTLDVVPMHICQNNNCSNGKTCQFTYKSCRLDYSDNCSKINVLHINLLPDWVICESHLWWHSIWTEQGAISARWTWSK